MDSALGRLRYIHIVGFVSGIAALASLVALKSRWDFLRIWIVLFWLLVPPVYFYFELVWVRSNRPDELEGCRNGQETASRIWGGVSAALILLFFEEWRP